MNTPTLTIACVGNPLLIDDAPNDELISEIRRAHAAAQDAQKNAVQCAIRVGELLRIAREDIPHGQWEMWLQAKCKFSARTARGYLRLAGLDAANRQRVAEMSLRNALADIASNSAKQRRRERELARDSRRETTPLPPAAASARSLPIVDAEIVQETIAGSKDAIAERILRELSAIKPEELTEPGRFAGQPYAQASRLNPHRMAL